MARRTAARHQQGRWAAQPSAAWPQRAQRFRPPAASVLGLTEWLPAPSTLCMGNAYQSRDTSDQMLLQPGRNGLQGSNRASTPHTMEAGAISQYIPWPGTQERNESVISTMTHQCWVPKALTIGLWPLQL